MRWGEAALLLLPFVLFAAWRVAGSHRVWATRVLWTLVTALVVVAAGGLWLGVTRGQSPGQTYVPARVQDGRIVGGS